MAKAEPGISLREVPWALRMWALGSILDRTSEALRDVLLLEVEDGFVVQGFRRLGAEAEDGWAPTTTSALC